MHSVIAVKIEAGLPMVTRQIAAEGLLEESVVAVGATARIARTDEDFIPFTLVHLAVGVSSPDAFVERNMDILLSRGRLRQ